MQTYTTAEPEDEDHVENENQDLTVMRFSDVVTPEGEKVAAVTYTLVCSCGSKRCGLISRLGLPEQVFHIAIEPLSPQTRRDMVALQIREGS